jgi:hypothetical protein
MQEPDRTQLGSAEAIYCDEMSIYRQDLVVNVLLS